MRHRIVAALGLGLWALALERPIVHASQEQAGAAPELEARVPEGWERVDATPGFGGWAKKVREPKSAIELILVTPGAFQMGSPTWEEGHAENESLHRVELTQAFYLGETEVTVGQWRRFVSAGDFTPERGGGQTVQADGAWNQMSGASWKRPIPAFPYTWDDRHPVTQVSWNDAQAFCAYLGCELPTEAQWEYACRAGTTTRYSWGDTELGGRGHGNFCDQSAAGLFPWRGVFPFEDGHVFTAPVGQFAPNAWGLHDMLGNVAEWCRDGYRADHQGLGEKDPFTASEAGRVQRGGSWGKYSGHARCANRVPCAPAIRGDRGGFRVARTLP